MWDYKCLKGRWLENNTKIDVLQSVLTEDETKEWILSGMEDVWQNKDQKKSFSAKAFLSVCCFFFLFFGLQFLVFGDFGLLLCNVGFPLGNTYIVFLFSLLGLWDKSFLSFLFLLSSFISAVIKFYSFLFWCLFHDVRWKEKLLSSCRSLFGFKVPLFVLSVLSILPTRFTSFPHESLCIFGFRRLQREKRQRETI